MKIIESLVSLDDAYGRAVTRGIIRYAKTRPQWKLFGYGNLFPALTKEGGEARDGIIARVESQEHAKILSGMGLPIIDVAGAYLPSGIAQVNNDDYLTGKKAAEYFEHLGFSNFAVCGVEKVAWWQSRKKGFFETLGKKSTVTLVFERSLTWWRDQDQGVSELAIAVKKLKPNTAIFAANDLSGLKLARVCARAGIAVPEDIAILGVDNEDLFCELSLPSLSSIALDCEGIGYRAAELLDSMIVKDPSSSIVHPVSILKTPYLIAPKEVMERESTRILLCNDALVTQAVNWIHTNVASGITVGDILAHVSASRRSLEQRFIRSLGRTPHDEIVLARLKRAKHLLSTGSATLEVVAHASGFGSLQRFHIAFKGAEGISPGEWRARQHGT